jgi:DNA-directed RNA polymerase subunit K/omega
MTNKRALQEIFKGIILPEEEDEINRESMGKNKSQ